MESVGNFVLAVAIVTTGIVFGRKSKLVTRETA